MANLFNSLGTSLGGLTNAFGLNLRKSMVGFAADFEKARKTGAVNQSARHGSLSQRIDPMEILNTLNDYREKPETVSYELLRRTAKRNAVVAAIVQTRIDQITSFAHPVHRSLSTMGFAIRPKDGSQQKTPAVKKEQARLEEFVRNCGFGPIPGVMRNHKFIDFMKMILRDRLIIDQACFEIIPSKKGTPYAFRILDGATIRKTIDHYETDGDASKAYVQVLHQEIVSEFALGELAFLPANMFSDIRQHEYGCSELEMTMHIIASHLYAEEYNARFFKQGANIKGILNLKDDNLDQESFDDFRRQFSLMLTGASNAWKTPVVSVKDMSWVNFGQSNREMEFGRWMEYLINVLCAVYAIDPAEVNFPNHGGTGGASPAFESSAASKLKASKDKGLAPMLVWFQDFMTDYLIEPLNEDFIFAFEGLDIMDESTRADLDSKKVKSYMTVNEVREQNSLPPIEYGDVVLDSVFVQNKSQESMMAGEGEGEEGEEGDGGDGEGGGIPEGEDVDGGEDTTENTGEFNMPDWMKSEDVTIVRLNLGEK